MFTSASFDRRLAALERAEAGRFGRPLGSDTYARVALARRIAGTARNAGTDAATLSQGPSLLLQR
ncbi:hypothetical protein GCM10022280_26230 [Sphingomonas swuensis]|uniref:Uncharacterized protein n=1 Tax=Sphingomonas swuensis TaxID=977800 RepID=A0ABP7TCM8_9SPHN